MLSLPTSCKYFLCWLGGRWWWKSNTGLISLELGVELELDNRPNLQSSPLYGHMSRCRQQYLNLASTLPKIPTKILGFQIRNILKNCISWGLENICLYLPCCLTPKIEFQLNCTPAVWMTITDFCPAAIIGLRYLRYYYSIHCLRGNVHENCSKYCAILVTRGKIQS